MFCNDFMLYVITNNYIERNATRLVITIDIDLIWLF